MFRSAIVKKPCKNFSKGLTTSSLGLPDYEKVLEQHDDYIKALKKCGLEIHILDADENHPDSTFVEDTAIVNENRAIITNPGSQSRKAEVHEIFKVLKDKFNYEKIERIEAPGTLDGGDVMRINKCYYIGLSSRTNKEGASQLAKILDYYGFTSQVVEMKESLHLKSGLNYIGDNCLLSIDEFKDNPLFQQFDIIHVEKDEEYAANCILVNGYIIMPKGYNKLKEMLTKLHYMIIELEMSEFKKMDGGLSCLSLRFPQKMKKK
ncbi:MAG: dimethylarginine dimethylaminohydrolase family protein [Promethearchaeota archaeon]